MKIHNREFVSFDGLCPYQCKHCFSFNLDHPKQMRTPKEIVDSLAGKNFDVVYVSQKKENFVNPDDGLHLCEKIFDKYGCNIVIITRNIFNPTQIQRLISLNHHMKKAGKFLFIGVSVVGLDSSSITENLSIIPSPEDRIHFAKQIYCMGIESMLLIRPLFPDKIIPFEELKKTIDMVAGNISCVLSGALMINENISKKLNMHESNLTFFDGGESEYLKGAISERMKFVDVRNEMSQLKNYCSKKNVPFFEHSIPAINYLISTKNID